MQQTALEPIKVILNPYAGRGRAGKAVDRVADALASAGLAFDIAITTGQGDAIELARQARLDGFAIVAAAGGDGTVNEVVNGLAQVTSASDPIGPLALLPLGSGNDFADMVGCPRDLGRAAAIMATGNERRIDLGCATIRTTSETAQAASSDASFEALSAGAETVTPAGAVESAPLIRYFDNNLGIGLEASITLASYRLKRLQGTMLYVVAALQTLRHYRALEMEVRCRAEQGVWQRSGRTLLVTIGNSRRTGGGFYLTPDALMDDGQLDVGIAEEVSTARSVTLLPRALMGSHTNDPAVTMLRCEHIQVRCQEGVPVQLDGEVMTERAAEIDVLVQAGRLRLLCG